MPRATVTPDTDYAGKSFTYDGVEYRIKERFQIFKFFRMLNENPVVAMELVIEPDDYAKLEELELSMDDFKTNLEGISAALGGESTGN